MAESTSQPFQGKIKMVKNLVIGVLVVLLPAAIVLSDLHGQRHVKINVLKNCLIQQIDPQTCLQFTTIVTHEE